MQPKLDWNSPKAEIKKDKLVFLPLSGGIMGNYFLVSF